MVHVNNTSIMPMMPTSALTRETNFSNGARPLRGVLVLGLGIARVRLKRQAP